LTVQKELDIIQVREEACPRTRKKSREKRNPAGEKNNKQAIEGRRGSRKRVGKP